MKHPTSWTHAACSIMLASCSTWINMQIQCSLPRFQGTLIAAPLAVLLDVVNLDEKSEEVNGEAVSTDVTYSQLEGCSIAQQCATYHTFCQFLSHSSSLLSLYTVSLTS